ncbi:MAG: sulfotransferase [Arenimonas sp.]
MSQQNTQSSLIKIKQLMNQGEFDIAQFECAKCLLEDEFNIEARVMMSGLYYRSGKYQSAVQYALMAGKLVHESSDWREVLATSAQLAFLGEEQAALSCMDLISINRDENISGAADIAKQFQLLESHTKALEWLALAEIHGVSLAQVTELRGMIYMFDGDLAGSEIELEKSISEYKNQSISPHLLLSMFGDAKARTDRLKAAFANKQFASADLPYLHYALFKEFDSLGQVDQAWEHLSTGSVLRRNEVFYSGELETRAYDELIAVTQNLKFATNTISGINTTPIFVIGMPRSGTSLLESMLAGDVSIAACGELKVMRCQIQFVLNKKIGNPFDRDILQALPDMDFLRLGQRYLEKAGWKAGNKPFFIDKNPGNFNYAGLILKALPNAKIINLTRHPMDVCFSNLKEIFGPLYYTYSYTQEECANHYKNYKRLMGHWHSIAPGRILDVAYENLVSQPTTELKRVQEFCGLALQPYEAKKRGGEFMSNTASTVQLREPIHKRNLNGWHRYQEYLGGMEMLLKWDVEEYIQQYLN